MGTVIRGKSRARVISQVGRRGEFLAGMNTRERNKMRGGSIIASVDENDIILSD